MPGSIHGIAVRICLLAPAWKTGERITLPLPRLKRRFFIVGRIRVLFSFVTNIDLTGLNAFREHFCFRVNVRITDHVVFANLPTVPTSVFIFLGNGFQQPRVSKSRGSKQIPLLVLHLQATHG